MNGRGQISVEIPLYFMLYYYDINYLYDLINTNLLYVNVYFYIFNNNIYLYDPMNSIIPVYISDGCVLYYTIYLQYIPWLRYSPVCH